jgi:hypothetical protein
MSDYALHLQLLVYMGSLAQYDSKQDLSIYLSNSNFPDSNKQGFSQAFPLSHGFCSVSGLMGSLA